MLADRVESRILFARGQKVLLDEDLAVLYGVETRVLVQAVKRNLQRFPQDFMFRLTAEEYASLRSQFVISKRRGGRRYLPFAFTEQGVAMLSGVLQGERAIRVNVEIMRAFVRLRRAVAENAELSRRMKSLESQIERVFRVLDELLAAPKPKKSMIGFLPARKAD